MAIGKDTFSAAGGAVTDIFGAFGSLYKAKGSRIEAALYDKAAAFARLNEQYTKESTAIKEAQQQRDAYKQIGGQEAAIGASGFAESGSALDILRESASQASLTKAVISQQGLIEEAGYEEQAQSYDMMAKASREAVKADIFGAIGQFAGGAIKAAAAIATL